ncbi:MAG: leucine-rich repeat protein [Christensenellales bacterium]
MVVENGILKRASNIDIYLLNQSPEKFWEGITEISSSGFSRVDFSKHPKLIIPESIKVIGNDAFHGCIGLEEVTLPSTLQSLAHEAFRYSSIRKIKIPDSISYINQDTFTLCQQLQEVYMPEGLEAIGHCAFDSCKNLRKIDIPDSVTTIDSYAFFDCLSLNEVKLPQNIQVIEEGTFLGSGLSKITIPKSVITIDNVAFSECPNLAEVNLQEGLNTIGECAFSDTKLTRVDIPSSVKIIKYGAFADCPLEMVKIPNSVEVISADAFSDGDLKTIFFKKNGDMLLTKQTIEQLKTDGIEIPEEYAYSLPFNYTNLQEKFRHNFVHCSNLKSDGKIKFIPQNYILITFPYDQMDNFFINKNYVRWAKLLKESKLDSLENHDQKINTCADLLKIYYALGGFSENQGESERAYNYTLEHIAKSSEDSPPEKVADYIHSKFSRMELKGAYHPTFAQFFMRHYHNNHNFMEIMTEEGVWSTYKDYLCQAHNNWGTLLKNYPNRVITGNEERSLLTPKFVAKHCVEIKYDNIDDDNENLAILISEYGYTQEQFDEIQKVYNKAKKIKDQYVIKADKSKQKGCVQFRLLEKDDPLGFVLGDITNCCQVYGGAAESCVADGYTNTNAGFIVFEETLLDKDGNPTEETRILGQAYIWYDPLTKTVCYDNIEIPTKVLNELFSGEKRGKKVSTSALLQAVEDSAEAIIKGMNKDGIKVKRVTTGAGYNDLKSVLDKKYKKDVHPKARHRNYGGYSDANDTQYIIKSIDNLAESQHSTPTERVKKNKIHNLLQSLLGRNAHNQDNDDENNLNR